MLESSIEDYFVSLCEKNGIWTDKYISGRRGVPDRLVIYHGRHVFVELKAPGKEPRKLQLEIHRRMRSYGAEIRVIDNKDDVAKFIQEILDTPWPNAMSMYKQ